MADQDVESVEAKKLRNATMERMRRKWLRENPNPHAHLLVGVTAEGDHSVLLAFYERERWKAEHQRSHCSVGVILAIEDIIDMADAVRACKTGHVPNRWVRSVR